jgi:hypothetical protein
VTLALVGSRLPVEPHHCNLAREDGLTREIDSLAPQSQMSRPGFG